MSPQQVDLVQRSWRSVLPVGDTFAELFYGKLLALDASLGKLFKDDPVEQGRNLTAMLSVAVGSLAYPERITFALRQLGKRHAAYGVMPEHFEVAEEALLFALEHALIDVWTSELESAWRAGYRFFATTMQAGAIPCTAVPACP
jgi:methyl-accepting chemotaxis protein